MSIGLESLHQRIERSPLPRCADPICHQRPDLSQGRHAPLFPLGEHQHREPLGRRNDGRDVPWRGQADRRRRYRILGHGDPPQVSALRALRPFTHGREARDGFLLEEPRANRLEPCPKPAVRGLSLEKHPRHAPPRRYRERVLVRLVERLELRICRWPEGGRGVREECLEDEPIFEFLDLPVNVCALGEAPASSFLNEEATGDDRIDEFASTGLRVELPAQRNRERIQGQLHVFRRDGAAVPGRDDHVTGRAGIGNRLSGASARADHPENPHHQRPTLPQETPSAFTPKIRFVPITMVAFARGVGALVLLVACGCGGRGSIDAGVTEGNVALQVGERRFSVKEIETAMRAQPEVFRARFATAEGKKDFIDALVRDEVLAREARRRGLERKPEVQAALNRLLIQQLINEEAASHAPGDEDARAWFDAHQGEFQRPERRAVSVVELAGSSKASLDADLAALKKTAGESRSKAFATLALQRSTHQSSRTQGGTLGPRTADELTQQFSAESAAAVFALKTNGELTGPVQTQRGWAVFMLEAIQPMEQRPFEPEKQRIIARLSADARQKQLQALIDTLTAKTTVTRDQAALEAIDVQPPPTGPLVP